MAPKSTSGQPSRKRGRKVVSSLGLEDAAESWFRLQRARGLSPYTIATRRKSLAKFTGWLVAEGRSEALAAITRRDVEDYLIEMRRAHTPESVLTYYSALQVFFRWCVAEEEIEYSPMAHIPQPETPDQPPTVLTEEEIAALLKTCAGKSFADRRDRAIFLLLIDTGMRLHEIGQLQLDMVDMAAQTLRIVGKGRRPREPHFEVVAAHALDSYLRARKRLVAEQPRYAPVEALWLGRFGALSDSGIYQVVRRRARAAGLHAVHPHLFRHGFAHYSLQAGMSEGSVARLAGWTPGSQMLHRYGASLAIERAQEDHKKFSPANRLAGKDKPPKR